MICLRLGCGSRCVLLTLSLLAVSAGGCAVDIYRHDTTLHADGSVTRIVLEGPGVIGSPEDWSETSRAPADFSGDLDTVFGPVEQRPSLPESDEPSPINAARGTFRSPAEIPQHFVRESPGQTLESVLDRRYERTDVGVFVEHRWRETVTDEVNIADSQQATRELAALYVDIFLASLQRAYGEDHDFTRLEPWLREDVVSWATELSGAYLQVASTPPPESEESREFVRICAGYGLDLQGPDGEMVADDARDRIPEFVAAKLHALVDRTDSQKMADQQLVHDVLRLLKLVDEDQAAEDEPTALEAAAERIIAERYGSNEALQAKTDRLLDRAFGVYGRPLSTPASFEFRMRVPGTIVECNGTLLSDHEVQWKFDGIRAFPFGYSMTCRSIQPNLALQRTLWDGKSITARGHMLEALALLRDETLQTVFRACAAQQSAAPLEQFHSGPASPEAAELRERLAQLERLAR